MKQYYTEADGGSIALGVEGFKAFFLVDGGDGRVDVKVFDSEKEFKDHCNEGAYRKYEFEGVVMGETINLYESDGVCGHAGVVETFSGRYGVYCGYHGYNKIALVKWN